MSAEPTWWYTVEKMPIAGIDVIYGIIVANLKSRALTGQLHGAIRDKIKLVSN